MAATLTAHGAHSPRSAIRVAAWMSVVGLVGVVAVSGFYAISPPATVLPIVPMDLDAALAGASAPSVRLISAVGIPADALGAVGGLLLAYARFFERGHGLTALGWALGALSSFLFLIVDTIAGSVLPSLATAPDAFLAIKVLFDLLFTAGVMCLALGALLVALPNLGRGADLPRGLCWLLLLVGSAGLVTSAGGLAGLNLALPMGISIAAAAALFALLSLKIARERDD